MMFWVKTKAEKGLSAEERKACIDDMLDNQFPLRLYVVSFTLNIVFSAASIAFQVVAVNLQAPNYFVYAG